MAEETRPRRGFQQLGRDGKFLNKPNTDTQNTDDATMRKINEDFGDMEYEYDLLPFLDSIARAGFDASRMQIGTPGKDVTSYQPLGDVVTIMPAHLADKSTQAHEYRHRGLDILMQELSLDALEFQKKYGRKLYLQLLDLKDTIQSQSQSRMVEAGNYNQYLHEMLAELYEKPEPYNVGAGYGAADAPPFSYNREAGRATTPAEHLALLENYSEETGNPIKKYVYPPVSVQEQMDELETDNQAAFREYLDTNPADRVERVFFKPPFEEGVKKQKQPLFETIDALSKFAEDANEKRGKRTPEDYFQVKELAQGGPVMNGIGTLNETARNMFSGPRGIGAYEQFAGGGMPQGPAGIGGSQLDSGLNQYGQYLEQTYGNPEFDQKRDTFLQEIGMKEQQTFGGFSTPEPPSFQTQPAVPLPFGPPSSPQFGSSSDLMNNPSLKQSRDIFRNSVMPALYASGGEAMGPPPTRGPDPQGIGYFQQFADGGPVYMQEGGDPFAEVDFDKLTAAVIQTESAGDPNAVSEDDAIGLMQVLPSTGAQPGYEQLGAQNVFDIAIDLGFPIDDSERTVEKARELLFEPEINVGFGTKYLRAMIAHSGGDIEQALQKYNAGTGNYQAFVEGRKPLDQEAVRYPVLVANALTGGNLASPFTPTPVQRGEDLIMSMPVAQSDAMSPLAIENRREGTEFQGQDAYSAGENLSRQTRQDFGSQAQQDDFEAMTPQNISMREKYSADNMAAELVEDSEEIKRPRLRPPEVEFGEDKGGVFRSLRPQYRPEEEPARRYPGTNTDIGKGLGIYI